jgi:hypothetical protein
LSRGLLRLLVQLHKLGEIELGLFEDLDLSNHAVVIKRENLAALDLDLRADFLFNAIKNN